MSLKQYITDNDNLTMRFIEKYGSITIHQCHLLFYSNQVYGNVSAGKHLNKLVKYGKLKVYRDLSGRINVYYMTTKLRYHNLLALDYYVELYHSGAEIFFFKQNQSWMNGKYISDAYCCYRLGDKTYFNVVETTVTHGLDKQKYIDLFESKEPQIFSDYVYKKIGGTKTITDFPKLILIDDMQHTDDYLYINDQVEIKQLNFKLNNFSNIFV